MTSGPDLNIYREVMTPEARTVPSEIRIQVVRPDIGGASRERLLADILNIQGSAYPSSWVYPDAKQYFDSMLANETAINIVAFREDGGAIGHILAVPIGAVAKEIEPYDKDITAAAENAYYIDDFAALPGNGVGILRRMIRMLEATLSERNVDSLAMHARVSNRLSKVLQRYFGQRIKVVRRIEQWHWYGDSEPTDYIEVQL